MSNLNTVMSQAAAASVEPDGAWDLSYAYFDDPFAWDLSTAVYLSKSFSLATYQTFPTGLFFKPDGTKMYSISDIQNEVREWSLSTAWDVSTASNVGRVLISTQDTFPQGVSFKPDGTKMYIIGSTSDSVHEYNLSTAWTVSTASFSQSFSVAAQSTDPTGLFFKPDGTKLYVIDTNQRDVYEYDLSTAWDVTSSSYLQSFNTSVPYIAQLEDLSISDDGLTMFILARASDKVVQYSLSTAWDISSSSYVAEFAAGSQEASVRGLFVRGDGSQMFVVGNGSDTVFQYTLGGFNVGTQEQTIEGIFFKPDGTKLYICGTAGDEVNEYDLSTAWDLSTASFLQALNVYSQTRDPASLFFKPDGTVMYVVSQQLTKTIFYYSLSTAWDISTAVFATSITIGTEVSSPTGVFFKPDGTKMYVSGSSGEDVNEYDLSTAWDVGTATYSQNFSVAAQDTSPQEVFFKDDGTKMYILGDTNNKVYEYELSTAWDVSTASYIKDFFINNVGGFLRGGLFFKPDGTKMYLGDFQTDSIYSYTLGVQE